MKCKKCDKRNPDNSKYCSFCGVDLTHRILFEHQELFNQITNHLEFIGYEIGKPEEIDDSKHIRVLATNERRSNLLITFNYSGMITFLSLFTLDKNKTTNNHNEALKVVNKMNLDSAICSFSLSENNESLLVSSWYPGEYSKKLFSNFLETYEADINARFNSSGIKDFA